VTQRIKFADFRSADNTPIEFNLVGSPGHEIDDEGHAGDVSLYIIGPLDEGKFFETVIDLQLPQARTVAAALVALADYVESADRIARKESAA
jgi:hypothetical protein